MLILCEEKGVKMNFNKMLIGSAIFIIDASFDDHDFYVARLADTLDTRFREAHFGHELRVSIVSIEKSCIKVKFLLVLTLLGNLPGAAIDVAKDYPEVKEGARQIIYDVKQLPNIICEKAPVQVICQNVKFNNGFYGPIGSGESLIGIVHQLDRDSCADVQVMVAIVRLNPHAFINGNVDKMLTGKVLQLPTDDEIMDIDLEIAKQEIAKGRRH